MRGRFSSDYFDYMKIELVGCDLGDECYDDSQLARQQINFLTIKTHASVINNQEDDQEEKDFI